jgi:hypothetical protein
MEYDVNNQYVNREIKITQWLFVFFFLAFLLAMGLTNR